MIEFKFWKTSVRRLIVVLCLGLVTAGCAPSGISSNVLRFHAAEKLPLSGTYQVQPGEGQERSLEFKAYAGMVGEELERLGYRKASANAPADLTVLINYSVDNGRTEIWSVPVYGYTDNWRRFMGAQGGWMPPYFDQIGVDTHSTTIFTHRLELRIMPPPGKNGELGENLFEGRAFAERTTREISLSMPSLVKALFTGFPGQNGVPVTIRIP